MINIKKDTIPAVNNGDLNPFSKEKEITPSA